MTPPPSMPGPESHSYYSQRLRLHYVDWGNRVAVTIAATGTGSPTNYVSNTTSSRQICAVMGIPNG